MPHPHLLARLQAFRSSAGPVLPCLESLALLVDYGIRGARGILARSPEDAVRWAQQLGCPVAMKVESPDIRHRKAANLVRLNVASAEEVRSTFRALMAVARQAFPAADIRGILVQEMIRDGTEVAIGLRHEPPCEPTIWARPGPDPVGFTERLVSRPSPLSRDDAEAMLRELGRLASPPRDPEELVPDLAALMGVLLGLSRLAEDAAGAIASVDIEPLLVLPADRGAIALGARAVLREAAAPPATSHNT